MRKHGLRCPQTDVTPHSLSTVLCALLQEVDDPAATALAEVLASASSNLGPLWVDHPDQDQSATLDILDTFCPGGALRWQAPSAQDIQKHPKTPNVLVGSACNPTTLSIVAYICSVLDRAHEWLPYRLKIRCLQQARLDYMHGVSCFPLVHARQESATRALLRSDMTPCVYFSKSPKPGALAHTHTRRSRRADWGLSIGALETATRWTRVCTSHWFGMYYQKCL